MKLVKAEIIAIGDELLYGQIMDTNSHWISQQLDLKGVKVVRKTTVGDNRDDILKAFSEAEKRADLVLITGGLGPTQDDLTKPLLAEYFNCPVIQWELRRACGLIRMKLIGCPCQVYLMR